MNITAKLDDPSSRTDGLKSTLRDYLELIRFSHTIFALPFAILVSVWAWILLHRESDRFSFPWTSLLGILVCMVAARSFAMGVNRLVDAKIDALNPRTASRHLPSGRLSTQGVLLFVIGCAIVFVAGTTLFFPNTLPIGLAVPLLIFLAGYSFAKRFTVLVHFWLGTALGLAPLCAWIALRGDIVMRVPSDILPAALVGLSVFLWVAGFDLIYACQDAQVDRDLGLKSLPAWLGVSGALRVAAFCHALMLLPFAMIARLCPQLGLGMLYWLGLIVVAVLLIYEHSVVSSKNLAKVNVAFFQANAVISMILLVTGVVDAWLGT
ncbi:MAG: UbiA-like polyprenyltransferase [Pirellulaceae bacterium]|nr:UbiA-like polyprenyltransferase [Pirellulaceae bacterium]